MLFPVPERDRHSGLNITTPGCYGMGGDMALSFVRARHCQYMDNSTWVSEAEVASPVSDDGQLFIK